MSGGNCITTLVNPPKTFPRGIQNLSSWEIAFLIIPDNYNFCNFDFSSDFPFGLKKFDIGYDAVI